MSRTWRLVRCQSRRQRFQRGVRTFNPRVQGSIPWRPTRTRGTKVPLACGDRIDGRVARPIRSAFSERILSGRVHRESRAAFRPLSRSPPPVTTRIRTGSTRPKCRIGLALTNATEASTKPSSPTCSTASIATRTPTSCATASPPPRSGKLTTRSTTGTHNWPGAHAPRRALPTPAVASRARHRSAQQPTDLRALRGDTTSRHHKRPPKSLQRRQMAHAAGALHRNADARE